MRTGGRAPDRDAHRGQDREALSDRENVFGRNKIQGARLGAHAEFDTPSFAAKAADGRPVIPVDAHVRLAAPENNSGRAILRRGYSYTDGIDPASGELDAGLFFIAFLNDPQVFIDLQNRLGANDALNEYIQHTASALFAVPGGVGDKDDYWGKSLLA